MLEQGVLMQVYYMMNILSHYIGLFHYCLLKYISFFFFFFQAEDGIRDDLVTGVQTCALPI